MIDAMRAVVQSTSWDTTAESMFALMSAGQAARAAAQLALTSTMNGVRGTAPAQALRTPVMAMDAIMAKRAEAEILSTAGGK
jgi:hypothetical protein